MNSNIARTMSELITPRQLMALRAIARANGLTFDWQNICKEQFGCQPEELNRRAASRLIDVLQNQPVAPMSELEPGMTIAEIRKRYHELEDKQ